MKDIHENSTESLREHEESGKAETYRQKVIDLLRGVGTPLTDREVWTSLGIKDVNNVRPHITRLKQEGRVVETGSMICPVTGKKVRLVTIKGK